MDLYGQIKGAVMRILCALLLGAVLLGDIACTVPPEPPRRVLVIPPRPYPDAFWVAGHWQWKRWRHEYVWAPGHWMERRGHRVIIVE